MTKDHKPHIKEERSRIERMGGKVITYDVPRFQGVLAISRAIGDTYLKPFVIAYPRILEGNLSCENDYAVLACDGVWDVLEPEDVMDIVRKEQKPQVVAEKIVKEALFSGSTDNITVIVVDLKDYTREINREKMEILRIRENEG